MADGTTPAAPASGSQRRKPRRKRNAGKKNDSGTQQKGGKGGTSKSNNKRSGSGGGNNSGPPPPPQIKITIRNIKNSERFGTVKSVLEVLVSKLMEACVEKKANNQYDIELDRNAVRHLITVEEKIKERREQMEREKLRLLEQKQDENKDSNETSDAAENGGDGDEKEKIEEGKEGKPSDEPSNETKNAPNDNNKLDVILASKTQSSLPTVFARPLYVVPPRKTRRRGERGGTAYVLLIGPKIEKKNPITTVPKEEEQKISVSSPQCDSEQEKPIVEETNRSDPADVSKQTLETPPPEEKVINYPQELAKGRLLLSNTLKALTELTVVDAKAQEFVFSGCIIEQSMNGKTWKTFQNNSSRPDRREGTIESTADFKEWMETTAKQKEELKARPKPVPGGGMTAATTPATTANGEELEEDGQLVSSLVQHLRAKKLDSKRKKSQKKKKKEESNKAAANNNNNNGNNKGDTTTAAGQSESEKKKKKRNEKKNRKNNNGGNPASGAKGDAAATTAATQKAKRKKKERMKKKEKAKAAAATAAGSKPPTAVLKPQPGAA